MPLYTVLPLAGVVLFGMSIISAPSSFLPATEHQNTQEQTHRTLNNPPPTLRCSRTPCPLWCSRTPCPLWRSRTPCPLWRSRTTHLCEPLKKPLGRSTHANTHSLSHAAHCLSYTHRPLGDGREHDNDTSLASPNQCSNQQTSRGQRVRAYL